jgi:DmsE family decaheme c-type cytochrome
MTWHHQRVVAVLGSLAALAVLLVAVQACSPQPKTPRAATPTPMQAPAGAYAGAETCKGCHEDAHTNFAQTKMGRLFLKQPRNDAERLGCENCHGPGKAHADAGGGKGKDAKIISFAKHDPTPVAVRNQMCVACHQQGEHLFWMGSPHESANVACTSCHVVMTSVSPKSQLAKQTVLDTCGTCHLRQRAQQFRSSHMPVREGKMSCT